VLEAAALPEDPQAAAGLLEDAGHRVELSNGSLDVIVEG
jgi:hypothetical protein